MTISARVHEIVQDGAHRRNYAENLLRQALHSLTEIPLLAQTRADRVMIVVLNYYLK